MTLLRDARREFEGHVYEKDGLSPHFPEFRQQFRGN
jgi:hypothetical protein